MTGLNCFLSVLSRHICKEISFICPRNFTAISWGVDPKEILFLAKTSRSGVRNQSRSQLRPFCKTVYKPDKIATNGINGQYSFRRLRNNLKMNRTKVRSIKPSSEVDFHEQSTRQVFVNYKIFKISGNSNGGHIRKLKKNTHKFYSFLRFTIISSLY